MSCSNTLESLYISYFPACAFPSDPVANEFLIATVASGGPKKHPPLDLSKTAKLINVELWSDTPDIQWITESLRSVEFKNLRQVEITIDPLASLVNPVLEMFLRDLVDLDRLLVELWTSHSVVLKVICREVDGRSLLPEITDRQGVHVPEHL